MQKFGFVKGMAVGMAAGAAVGMLCAPKKMKPKKIVSRALRSAGEVIDGMADIIWR